MISLTIKDLKNFMSHLLIKDTFDTCLLCEADIDASCSFHIDGKINQAFYSADELSKLEYHEYTSWSEVKAICFQMIKGNHTPSSMKFVFKLSEKSQSSIIDNLPINQEDINGLYINIRYYDGKAYITTGTSFKIFTMDKSVDKSFDTYIMNFLEKSGVLFEEN